MESGRHTYAGQLDGQSIKIHFSNEVPDYSVSTHAPVETDRANSRERELRVQVQELNAQLLKKTEEIGRLQELLDAPQENAGSVESSQPETCSMPSVNSKADEISKQEIENHSQTPIPEDPVSVPLEENSKTNSRELTPTQKRYAEILLYLLKQPEQTVRHPNVGRFIRDELRMELRAWSNAVSYLGESGLGIVKLHKKHEYATRSHAITLNVETLLAYVDKPFVTSEVLEVLHQASNGDTTQPQVEGEQPDREDTSEAPKELKEGDIVRINSPRSTVLGVSRRVAKALERDPDPVPGYRREPEDRPFLAHSRVRSGTRRR